jgi:hypothetical protein
MILSEWDAPDGDPGQSCVHLFARILSTSFTSVSIFSVCCYSSVSISMGLRQIDSCRKVSFQFTFQMKKFGLAFYESYPVWVAVLNRVVEHSKWCGFKRRL